MEKKGDLSQILAGLPVPVMDCNIALVQPKVIDICAFGEDKFINGVNLFVQIDKIAASIKQDNGGQLSMLGDFQVLMAAANSDFSLGISMQTFLDFIVPECDAKIGPGSVDFKSREEGQDRIVGQLNPMNFEFFKSLLKFVYLPRGSEKEIDYNPANDKAKAIADKIKAGREKLQRQRAAEEGDFTSLFGMYVSVLAVGLGMDINLLYSYTPFQLYDLFDRYMKKQEYDFYRALSTTPFVDTSKIDMPDPWVGNIYKDVI